MRRLEQLGSRFVIEAETQLQLRKSIAGRCPVHRASASVASSSSTPCVPTARASHRSVSPRPPRRPRRVRPACSTCARSMSSTRAGGSRNFAGAPVKMTAIRPFTSMLAKSSWPSSGACTPKPANTSGALSVELADAEIGRRQVVRAVFERVRVIVEHVLGGGAGQHRRRFDQWHRLQECRRVTRGREARLPELSRDVGGGEVMTACRRGATFEQIAGEKFDMSADGILADQRSRVCARRLGPATTRPSAMRPTTRLLPMHACDFVVGRG